MVFASHQDEMYRRGLCEEHPSLPITFAELRGVLEATDGMPVSFDSGVRSGADMVTALALAAAAVGIGRPYVYALALGGTDGIVHVLRSLLAEADLLMAVDGYPSRADLTPEALRRVE